MTTTPPPRLVPDRLTPAMRAVLIEMLTNCHTVDESYADLLAAAPPAEAPAERGEVQWDSGSPCMEPRPVGMVYPPKPTPRASGYLDGSGVEWNAYDTAQMEAYARDAVASYHAAPAAPAEGEWLPKDNDGREQDAFEAWAKGEGFDMHQHPLHWLFLNERTNAARRGWRGALAYVTAQAATAPRVTGGREDSERVDWLERRVGDFHNIDRISSENGRFNRLPTLREAIDAAMTLQAATGGEG